MRTLEKLLEHYGKIFIRLENTTVAERFLRNAEKEGAFDAKRAEADGK